MVVKFPERVKSLSIKILTSMNLTLLQSLMITCTIIMAVLFMFASYDLTLAGGHKGHVHINVWRGPSKGHKKHKFAPWGYYAKLPADEGKKKHYG